MKKIGVISCDKWVGKIKEDVMLKEQLISDGVATDIISWESDINYDDIPNLASEAREKLKQVKPLTIGQASRISGVNPADISILLVYIESRRKK